MNRIKDLREDSDMTQSELASKLHVRQNTISQYEREERDIPTQILIELSKIFDTTTDYILGISKNRKKGYTN